MKPHELFLDPEIKKTYVPFFAPSFLLPKSGRMAAVFQEKRMKEAILILFFAIPPRLINPARKSTASERHSEKVTFPF